MTPREKILWAYLSGCLLGYTIGTVLESNNTKARAVRTMVVDRYDLESCQNDLKRVLGDFEAFRLGVDHK